MIYKIPKKKIDEIRKAQIIDEINHPSNWHFLKSRGLGVKNPLSYAELIYNRDE